MAVAEEKGLEVDVIKYALKAERPNRETLERVVAALEDPVEDLVRKDSRFKKLGLDAERYVGDPEAVVELLEREPLLLQRPVLVRGNAAIIGRPRDRVDGFFS